MVGLGDLPGGSIVSSASGVSADGFVIVGDSMSAAGMEAFRWTSGGGMAGLGDLPGGGFFSQAKSASADGSVVVGLGHSAAGFEAFRWDSGGGMVGLGHLPGDSFSIARSVSADGSVVVGESHADASGAQAFRWTMSDGMKSVRQLLIDAGVDMAGWTLFSAQGVSADGRVVVGFGRNPSGVTEAWLADFREPVAGAEVPEPAAVAIWSFLSLLAVLQAKRRTRR
jgi:probable HAF family extracellular repeat protein